MSTKFSPTDMENLLTLVASDSLIEEDVAISENIYKAIDNEDVQYAQNWLKDNDPTKQYGIWNNIKPGDNSPLYYATKKCHTSLYDSKVLKLFLNYIVKSNNIKKINNYVNDVLKNKNLTFIPYTAASIITYLLLAVEKESYQKDNYILNNIINNINKKTIINYSNILYQIIKMLSKTEEGYKLAHILNLEYTNQYGQL